MRLVSLVVPALLWATSVLANPMADAVVAELVEKGYSQVTVERTWLGRLVITAILGDRIREITLNPKTGEILHDYVRRLKQDSAPVWPDDDHGGDGDDGGNVTVASSDTDEKDDPDQTSTASGAVEGAAGPGGNTSASGDGADPTVTPVPGSDVSTAPDRAAGDWLLDLDTLTPLPMPVGP